MSEPGSVEDVIKELAAEGESLVPQGGSQFQGYNGRLQPQYITWRHRSIAALQELGQATSAILKDLDADKHGPYFYESSAARVLGSLKAALAIAKRAAARQPPSPSPRPPRKAAPSRKAFIVHGHDRSLLEQAARFLERLMLEPIVLFEQAGAGRTLIEKLEQHGDVTAAIVLLTPDDIGKAAAETEESRPRARQNVVLELGYFIGRLGRDRVMVMYDESVELPSDYRGMEYIKVDAEGAWKLKLARELKQAGLAVDMNLAI